MSAWLIDMGERFTFANASFHGPLEALLDLIEGRKLPISQVNLAEVADSYLEYVEKLPALPLGETAQFVLVASTLLLIKSRTLLPLMELSPDEKASVEELERRLKCYELIRSASKGLRAIWGKHPLVLARRAPIREPIFSPANATTSSLFAAARKLVDILPKPERFVKAAVAPVLALEEVVVRLKRRLASAFRAGFFELTRSSSREEAIVYFLAMLELVRSGGASISQEKLFEDITIEISDVATPTYGS